VTVRGGAQLALVAAKCRNPSCTANVFDAVYCAACLRRLPAHLARAGPIARRDDDDDFR
jgi:hypothetical protein